MLKLKILLVCLFAAPGLFAEPWEGHQKEIEDLERNIYKFEQELAELVAKKKKTRDKARIEETLQRIVEIHAELISLRKGMDTMRSHLKEFHPEKAHILDNYDSRKKLALQNRERYKSSPISKQLDQLLIKVQLKFSSFMAAEDQKKEIREVEKVVRSKRKKKREREADVYLRRRSKVKLVK